LGIIPTGGVQKLSGAVFCKASRRSAKIKRSGFLQSQSGGVQKLSGAVFCTRGSARDSISSQWRIGIMPFFFKKLRRAGRKVWHSFLNDSPNFQLGIFRFKETALVMELQRVTEFTCHKDTFMKILFFLILVCTNHAITKG